MKKKSNVDYRVKEKVGPCQIEEEKRTSQWRRVRTKKNNMKNEKKYRRKRNGERK